MDLKQELFVFKGLPKEIAEKPEEHAAEMCDAYEIVEDTLRGKDSCARAPATMVACLLVSSLF